MSFISEVREKAKSLNNRIVLPESTDERVLKATEEIVKEKLSVPVLIGNAEELTKQAQELGVSLEGAEIIDPINFSKLDEYVAKLVELRSKKGMTEEQAKEILTSDVNFLVQ